jgi:C4-dicarboxylate-specific signal transduction histidine kinase
LIATDRISKIVLGMKAISRGNNDDNFETISVERLFTNTMIFCLEKFKNANVELIVATFPQVNLSCRETQVSQVILNLLNNASDAIEELEEKWVKVDFNLLENESKIQFVFTDSGNGIPDAVLAKIMTPFFTTKAVGKGTGLGLSISQNIIKEHGGVLEYNKLSPKTQFIITLNYFV